MASRLEDKVPEALRRIGQTLSKSDLLEYRAVAAALLDEALGEIPEVDLVLLAHRHGVARLVADTRTDELSKRDASRLTKVTQEKLFGVSESSAHYVVTAWAGAFGKVVPPYVATTSTVKKAASPPKRATPKRAFRKPGLLLLLLAPLTVGALGWWHNASSHSVHAEREADWTSRLEEQEALNRMLEEELSDLREEAEQLKQRRASLAVRRVLPVRESVEEDPHAGWTRVRSRDVTTHLPSQGDRIRRQIANGTR